MSTPEVFTYNDALNALEDFVSEGMSSSMNRPQLRRCILTAYRQIMTYNWSFLIVNGRIQLVVPYTTGTVVYDKTGGTYERQLTLTGGVWPTDSEDYSVRFDDIVCDIESRKSDTVVTLDTTMSPVADVASTTFSCYPRYYLLPNDFVSMSATFAENSWRIGRVVTPEEMLGLDRNRSDTGWAKWYSIGPAPDLHGAMALFINPPSDANETLDFTYRRRARQLRYSDKSTTEYNAGAIVSVTANSATVTGTNTVFESGMIGSIFRISSSTDEPTGLEGTNPWVEQRSIQAVASTTSLTLDAAASTSRSDKGYTISDPIDLDVVVWDAFLRMAESHVAHTRGLKNRREIARVAQDALFSAKGADQRYRQRRIAGQPHVIGHRLKDSTNRPEAEDL